jgi:ribosomal protein S24E
MELHTLKEKEMNLLSRKRISLMIDTDGATPSRLDLLKAVSKKFGVHEDLVVIKHIYPQFGKKNAKLIVHIYQDKDKMALFEHKNLISKHKPKPKEVKAE